MLPWRLNGLLGRRRMRSLSGIVLVTALLTICPDIDATSSTSTTTASTTTASTSTASPTTSGTTTSTTTNQTSTSSTTTTATSGAGAVAVVAANNLTALIVGVSVGIVVVLALVGSVAVGYVYYRRQREKVHPEEEEDTSVTSEEEEEESIDTRPTTASHIFVDDLDGSKPVTMTPFQLRKLFVETFPYSRWRPRFDGSLRARIPLGFVSPSLYRTALDEESNFRENIRTFESHDNESVGAPSSVSFSRQIPPVNHTLTSPRLASHGLEPLPEADELLPSDELANTEQTGS